MKKVLIGTKNSNDMTSWLRAWGAFTHSVMKPHVQPVRPPNDDRWVQDWTFFHETDCIFLHRPYSPMDFMIIERAKLTGTPLWVDLDDDCQKLTPDNPHYSFYTNPAALECIDHAIKEADVLTVGGAVHAERLRREYDREVILIPNALDDRLLGLKKPFKYSKRVAWRGSDSHRTDLLFYRIEIADALKADEYETCFFGFNPFWFGWDNVPYKWVDKINLVFEFYIALTSYNACFHLTPMVDTEFNRVKSNLCWTDATLAGSVCFAPAYLPEYDRPGIWHYEPNHFYRDLLEFLDCNQTLLGKMHSESWEWICDNILQSKINRIRLDVLKNL